MPVTPRLPHLTCVLLLLAAPFAAAESPLPDPIAPAVLGRPLDRIWPMRPLHRMPAAVRPGAKKQGAVAHKGLRPLPHARVALAPMHARGVAAVPGHAAVVAAAPAAVPAQQAAAVPPVPTRALAQRTVPATQVAGAGRSTLVASRRLGPGTYFNSQDHALVRSYYEAHPLSGQVTKWKLGEPIPSRSALTGVPDDLRAALPALPPGHQYVQVDGDVVLVAVQSRVVVDGISRGVP